MDRCFNISSFCKSAKTRKFEKQISLFFDSCQDMEIHKIKFN